MSLMIDVIIHTPEGKRKVSMPEGDFYVGRTDLSDLVINNENLSRKHLHVKCHGEYIYISDLGTTNGSYINGKSLEANRWYEVIPGDHVRLGLSDIKLELSIKKEEKSADVLEIRTNTKQKTQVSTSSGTSSPASNNYRHSTPTSYGNAAVKIDEEELLQKESELNAHIDDIQNQVSGLDTPQLSEIQMLQIKKLEIDSKVAAVKIKEDAEALAHKLVEDAKEEAQNIEEKSLAQIKDITNKINDLKEQINDLNDKKFELNEEKDNLTFEFRELSQKNNELEHNLKMHQEDIEEIKNERATLLDQIQKEEQDFEAKKQKEIKKHNNNIQDLISDAQTLESEKDTIKDEIKVCLDEKNELETQIETLKDRENAAQENYHKTQERVDKIYSEKEKLEESLKEVEEKHYEITQKKSDVEAELKTFQIQIEEEISSFDHLKKEKELELSQIEDKIQGDFTEEKEKLDKVLEGIRQSHKIEEESLLKARETMADEILNIAKSEAENLKNDAKEVMAVAKEEEEKIQERVKNITQEIEQTKAESLENIIQLRKDSEAEMLKMQENTVKEYEDSLVRAKEKSDLLVNEAKTKAEDIITEARNEAKEFFDAGKEELEKAQSKANELIKDAQDKALQTHKEGLQSLEERKNELYSINEEKDNEIKNKEESIIQLGEELEVLKSNLELEREKLKAEIQEEKNTILNKANIDSAEIISHANDEKQKIIDEAKVEIQQMQKSEEIKFNTKMREEKTMLTKLRAQEMDSLKSLREKQEAELINIKKASIDQIAKNIETLINLRLQKFSDTHLSGAQISAEAQNIRKIVQESMSNKKSSESPFLKMINPYGSGGMGKSTKEMKKIAIIVGIILSLVSVHFIFPEFYPSIKNKIAGAVKVENSAKDLFLEGVKEKRKNKPKFEPVQTKDFKETYTENVLYTTNFSTSWLADDLQRDWAVKVDEVIVYKLQLPDQKVVQFISQEFKMVRELKNMAAKIKFESQEEQIKEMKKFERENIKKLIKILDGPDNFDLMKEQQKKFFSRRNK